jgi:gliding motility-associated-like protein
MKFRLLLIISILPFCLLAQPTIISQDALSTQEEKSITIRLTDLNVYDPLNPFYPWGFSLTVYEGEHYTLDGHTVIPTRDFAGTLSVPVTVFDGRYQSNVFSLQITVTPVNDPPVITGQKSLTTTEGTPITLQLTDLTVTDPDNPYPTGYTLTLASGAHYSTSANTITPAQGFTGTITVKVRVNDGQLESQWFDVKITVTPGNKKPVIVSQQSLTTSKGQPITIQLTDLQVTDPDNVYPNDFSLKLLPGSNYTVSGNVITPVADFTGNLTVKVVVNDGKVDSDPFNLLIKVTDDLSITGQEILQVNEDESLTIKLSDLKVHDPTGTYPSGFNVVIGGGENYTAVGSTITPSLNYAGKLTVAVNVKNQEKSSPVYNVAVTVNPVNDPPSIANFEKELVYDLNSDGAPLAEETEITDVDDTNLVLAEIGFREGMYQKDFDQLIFNDMPNIRGVFDANEGVLSLIGSASISDYQQAIRSVRYKYNYMIDPISNTKIMYIKVNDGKIVSDVHEKPVKLQDLIELDIPNGFTPNNDKANDTWVITAKRTSERIDNIVIRVYDKRGLMVFESKGIDEHWDGRYKGETLPPDTYFYTIDLQRSFDSANLTGVVTILR